MFNYTVAKEADNKAFLNACAKIEKELKPLKKEKLLIDVDGSLIQVYYTDSKMDEAWIENGEEAKHSIVYGSVWFEDNEIEECRWNYNNKGT